MWRLYKYPLYDRSHAVERLPVHLPFQQTVIFAVSLTNYNKLFFINFFYAN